MIGVNEGDPVPPSTIVVPARRTDPPSSSPSSGVPDGPMGAASSAAPATIPMTRDALSILLLTIGDLSVVAQKGDGRDGKPPRPSPERKSPTVSRLGFSRRPPRRPPLRLRSAG